MPTADLGECSDLEFDDWIGIDEPFEEGDVALYPNPASDMVQLVIDRPGGHAVNLIDLSGKC